MGGCSYDRDVYSSSSSSGWGSYGGSSTATSALSSKSLSDEMKSLDRVIESNSDNPIIIVLDVTGSNTDFAKIVYDKMPMFYGQIEQQGYLKDFDISICAVGDAHTDAYPLQIANFAKGKDIDEWLKKLVLEGNGGGQEKESYELAAYYMLHNTKFKDGAKPILIFLGDESPYMTLKASQIHKYVSGDVTEDVGTDYIFKELFKKFESRVYMFLNPYCGDNHISQIEGNWISLFGKHREQVIKMKKDNEQAIVDLMLGTISLVSGSRNLKDYSVDMLNRGQTTERIGNVTAMLGDYSKSLVPVVNISGIQANVPTKTEGAKTKKERL